MFFAGIINFIYNETIVSRASGGGGLGAKGSPYLSVKSKVK